MALPEHILVHVGTVKVYAEDQSDPAEWIEGEPGPHGGGAPALEVAFPCVLFLPGPGGEQQNPYRQRVVREPLLLYNPTLDDGTSVIVNDESEVLVDAPELAGWTGAAQARWLAVGDGQPFGPPGEVIGVQATLRQVRD